MFQVDPRGVLAVAAVAMCFALAVLLYRTGVPGSMGRRLSLLLVFEGLTLGTSDVATYFLVDSAAFYARVPWLMTLQGMVHYFGDCGMLLLYPPFLAAALNTRLTRPFANRKVQGVLLVLVVAIYILVQTTPLRVGIVTLYMAMSVLFTFALLASIGSWRRARGAARQRALVFMLAFGFRDLCWGFTYAFLIWAIWHGYGETIDAKSNQLYFAYVLGTLVAVPLIAYGILRTQMFDIDLRIRWTIKQSTLAAIIIATIYLVSEGAAQLVSAELGGFFGLLAAAVVVFFLAPLQRFAERVAAVTMPRTQNTPEYVAFRKMQVYETAVAEILADGSITAKERGLLNHLRESLGIGEADAAAIESGLRKPGI